MNSYKELKAIIMAILSPQGHIINLNDQNFKYMEQNANRILKICNIEENEKSSL